MADQASEERIRRAAEAKQLLENPMLAAALDALEMQPRRDWAMSQPHETEKREEAYRRLKAAQSLRALLTTFVTTGMLEEAKVAGAATSATDAVTPPRRYDSPNERRNAL